MNKRDMPGVSFYVPPRDVDVAQSAIRLLSLLNSSEKALSTDDVKAALQVDSYNAVGGTTKKINSILADLGFQKEMVYRNPKRQNLPRYWIKSRLIGEAIDALEKRVESQK